MSNGFLYKTLIRTYIIGFYYKTAFQELRVSITRDSYINHYTEGYGDSMVNDVFVLYKFLLKYREISLDELSALTRIPISKLVSYLNELEDIVSVMDGVVKLNKPLDLAVKSLNIGISIKEVSSYLEWRDFEKISAEVLELNNYMVYLNLRVSKPVRFEIDIIGVDPASGRGIFIDCKHWSRGGSIKNLTAVAEQHYARVLKFVKYYDWFRSKWVYFNYVFEAIPLVVTLTTPLLRMHSGTIIVSIQELNNILLDLPLVLETLNVKPIVLRTSRR